MPGARSGLAVRAPVLEIYTDFEVLQGHNLPPVLVVYRLHDNRPDFTHLAIDNIRYPLDELK